MDVALYEKLLEDVRSDLDRSAPKVAEMQSVSSFLERRLGTVSDKNSYQNVLDDISADLQRETHSVAELERIDRFVSSQLGKPEYKPPADLPKPLAPVIAERPAGQPKPQQAAAKTPSKSDEDTKDESSAERLDNLPSERAGMTIEFGPDGFPINSGSKGKAGKDSKKAAVPEGATINFGPDGFPIDAPSSKN